MMPQKSSLVTMCPALQIWIGDQWVLLQMYVHIIPRSWDGFNSSLIFGFYSKLIYYFFLKQIKNQGSCKSSWAFSATGTLEGQLYKASRQLVSLSEQQLLDCTEAFGNNGCYGGVTSNAFTYVTKSGGICRESSYPYLGYVSYKKQWHAVFSGTFFVVPFFVQVNGCAANYCSKIFSCTGGYVRIQTANEKALMQATYNVGPIRYSY